MKPISSPPNRLPWLLAMVVVLAGCTSASPPRRATTESSSTGSGPSPTLAISGWISIGLSVERRPLLVAESGSGPLRIYVVGGIHGDETEGRSALESLRTQRIAGARLRILRDLNPDGTAAARRLNARALDLNRNWPASNFRPGAGGGDAPLSEPESRALHQDLQVFQPDVVLVLHSTPVGPMVNYDGPAEPLASAFVGAVQAADPGWYVRPDMGYPTPGSLGSWLGVDRRIPILTIEFGRGQDEGAAARALRAGLLATIRAASQTPLPNSRIRQESPTGSSSMRTENGLRSEDVRR